MDVSGFDLRCDHVGSLTASQIAAQCDATPGCASFNVFTFALTLAPRFCLKNATLPLTDEGSTYMQEACQGTLIRCESPRVSCPARSNPGVQTESAVDIQQIVPCRGWQVDRLRATAGEPSRLHATPGLLDLCLG